MSCAASVFSLFLPCDCGDPALLPSGGLSVSRAAEENHSRGCLEKSRHMLPQSLPGFLSGRLSSHVFLSPRYLTWTNISTSRWPYSHFFFLSCRATVCPLRLSLCTFPSLLSSPCVCLCSSSSSCLIFLETNYRALQEEKKLEGEQFRQRASRFLPSHFHEDLFFSLTSLTVFHFLYICLCPFLIYIPLFPALFLFFFMPLKYIT